MDVRQNLPADLLYTAEKVLRPDGPSPPHDAICPVVISHKKRQNAKTLLFVSIWYITLHKQNHSPGPDKFRIATKYENSVFKRKILGSVW